MSTETPSSTPNKSPNTKRSWRVMADVALRVVSLLALGVAIGVIATRPNGLFSWNTTAPRPTEPTPPQITRPTPTKPLAHHGPALLTAPFTAQEAKAAQAAWAKYLKREVEDEVDLGGGLKLVLVLIPPGKFTMGSPEEEKERTSFNEAAHAVTITRPFYLGKYAVTQEQYEKVTGKNGSQFSAGGIGAEKVKGLNTSRFPVEGVKWEEAKAFCQAVGQKAGWGEASLPTEAQWEYACRGGTTMAYYFGDDATKLDDYAWYDANSGERSHPVGEKKANPFGLYDMHGNVFQWCLDYYGPYERLDKENPIQLDQGPDNGRVVRGGGWPFAGRLCRSAERQMDGPDHHMHPLGLRVCFRLD